jgi:hypothetical protein
MKPPIFLPKEEIMKRTGLIWLIVIILPMTASTAWAQAGHVKTQEPNDGMTYFRLGVGHYRADR